LPVQLRDELLKRVTEGRDAGVTEDEPAESALVEAAKGGDQQAFRSLVEPIQRELHLFCYRMTGSFHDAEDVLQEALVNAWRRLETFEGRANFRAWLYRIAANAGLDALRNRRRRLLPQHRGLPTEVLLGEGTVRADAPWLEPYPDSLLPEADPQAAAELRESVRLAFLRALQLLPPRQRAVLILRDVLDWSAADVARMMETTRPAVNSALQRARATISRGAGRRHEQTASTPRDEDEAELAARYIRAWEAGDIDGIVAMLTEDAIQSMPPWDEWFSGRESLRNIYAMEEAWGGPPGPGRWRVLPTRFNGQLAFAEYARQRPEVPYRAFCLTVVTLAPGASQISELTSFLRQDLFAKFGLPASIDE
jgi:RNA polymerase sigma-70 factor, ECF subfamily